MSAYSQHLFWKLLTSGEATVCQDFVSDTELKLWFNCSIFLPCTLLALQLEAFLTLHLFGSVCVVVKRACRDATLSPSAVDFLRFSKVWPCWFFFLQRFLCVDAAQAWRSVYTKHRAARWVHLRRYLNYWNQTAALGELRAGHASDAATEKVLIQSFTADFYSISHFLKHFEIWRSFVMNTGK